MLNLTTVVEKQHLDENIIFETHCSHTYVLVIKLCEDKVPKCIILNLYYYICNNKNDHFNISITKNIVQL